MIETRVVLLLLFLVNGCLSSYLHYGYHLKVGVPKALDLLIYESVSTRIIGGSQVNVGVIPYQAGIVATLTTGQTSICGGSLISNIRVLTAAHCWNDGQSQAKLFTVVLGSGTIFSEGTRQQTSDVVVHPNWNVLDINNDIAMVRIVSVSFNNNIGAISLPTLSEVNLDFSSKTATVSGYGKNSDGQTSFPATTSLHSSTVTIITNVICQDALKFSLQASHLCTSGVSGTTKVGTCDGDSGGPLVTRHNDKDILVGVVSFGLSEGCEFGSPSVYTRVTSFLSWILANM